jgi:hypothetical protein
MVILMLSFNVTAMHGHQHSKAELVKCLEVLAPWPTNIPNAEVRIVDGIALVHKLEPKKSNTMIKTFSDYAHKEFRPYLTRQFQFEKLTQVDVVWDTYRIDSLKAGTGQSQGTGVSLCVAGNTAIPQNWSSFLLVDSNKKALFAFLASAVETMPVPDGKLLLTTHEEDVISNPPSDVSQLQSCTHEEADLHMLLHAWHAYQQGYRWIVIHATDKYVLVLAIAVASVMNECELWLAFGHGTKFRYIAAHTIADELGADKSWGLLFLHAVSGCETVSAFCGIGEKTAWDVWISLPI